MMKLREIILGEAVHLSIAALVIAGVVHGVEGARNVAAMVIGIFAFAHATSLSASSIEASARRFRLPIPFLWGFNRTLWFGMAAIYAWHGYMLMACLALFVVLSAIGRGQMVEAKRAELIAQEMGHVA